MAKQTQTQKAPAGPAQNPDVPGPTPPAAQKPAPPLTEAEIAEMEQLETGCLNGAPYPYPDQMKRLRTLRERFKGKIQVVHCTNGACRKDFAVVQMSVNMVCPLCRKPVNPQQAPRGR